MDRETALDLSCESGLSAMLRLDSPAYRELSVRRMLKFAELVAAKEREACARICNDIGRGYFDVELHEAVAASIDCTKAIRARGATDGQTT